VPRRFDEHEIADPGEVMGAGCMGINIPCYRGRSRKGYCKRFMIYVRMPSSLPSDQGGGGARVQYLRVILVLTFAYAFVFIVPVRFID
jgi:hypothetical protein